MKKTKGFWLRLGALCLVLCLCVSLAACRGQDASQTPDGTTETQPPVTYSLEVLTQGGSTLSDVTVFVYADDTLTDLVAVAKTDKDGKAEFTYAAGEGYVAVLTDVPQGYKVEEKYSITGQTTTITLTAELVEGDLSNVTYKLGDVMQDFTVTSTDGTEYKLSELLQEKKAVVLNFWFLSCNPCKQEFPYLQEAYEAYKDELEVIAIDPVDTDNEQIKAYAADLGLTFPMGAGDKAWEKAMKITAYPTTVVIDRFGTIALTHTGTIPDAQKFKDIFAFFTAEDYTQTVVEDVETLFVTEPEADAVENPVDISGQSSFQLTVQPGKIHYLNIHKAQNVWLQVNNSDIYVEYSSKKFTASNGTVGLLVSAPSTFEPAQLGFGNSGDKVQTFTVTLSNLAGSYGNPYTLQIGEFSVSEAAGNDQGVYFSYTAPQDGYFKLECISVSPSVDYDFSVMNLTTSAMRNLSGEGQTNSETGRKAVVMPMNQGEKLRITISTLPDESNNYPAATFKVLASFDAGEVEDVVKVEKAAYAVTVTDENRNPVPGVNIRLTGTQNNRVSGATDENGVTKLWINKDSYTGVLVAPIGYQATTTQFELTPEAPYLSIKLDTVEQQKMVDYTVRVVDDSGDPMANVTVVIGKIFGITDQNGIYTANLAENQYDVMLVVPAGYASGAFTYTFPENSNCLGITLTKQTGNQGGVTGGDIGGSTGGSGGSNQGRTQYTVRVRNAIGSPAPDVMVTVYNKAGESVGIARVNSLGEAIFYLDPGNYTMNLIGASGATLIYDTQTAVLSEQKTTATVVVATEANYSIYQSDLWDKSYEIYNGSNKLDLTDKTNKSTHENLTDSWTYVFCPSTSGVYTFHVTGDAVLTEYGTVILNTGDQTTDGGEGISVTVRNGSFDNNNQPIILLGVKPNSTAGDVYITVTRTADAPAELPVQVYTATSAPIKFTLAESGTITYVDLEGTAELTKKANAYYLNGKRVYVNIGKSAPYLTMSEMMGLSYNSSTNQWVAGSTGTGLKGLSYQGDKAVAIIDFTQCMRDYIVCCDPENGLYPLTADLITMFQKSGEYMGWWDAENPTYRFEELDNLNTDIAWMFACCYIN